MSDDDLNRVDASPDTARRQPGDLPEAVARRYLSEAKRGLTVDVAFYVDATTTTPAFRDRGGRLTTPRSDPDVVRDLVAIAAHRGWTTISVRGETSFRREVWKAAVAAGIEVKGYRPTEREQQERDRAASRSAGRRPEKTSPPAANRPRGLSDKTREQIVETVVRRRIISPKLQAKILTAVRGRLRPDPSPTRTMQGRQAASGRAQDVSRDR
ncbi:MAG: hypothetical protein DI570_02685 [Phenylobacterium zucineum]|nr:MAG: hypothetical protein DI570_02685 [Phenylobacterium zucineum]